MKEKFMHKYRFWFAAAVLIIAAVLCCAVAMAETAQDITAACKFNAGSGRKSFSRCKDRNYKTFWQTDNGPRAYVEVTVPAGQSASGVMVQMYEHPHAWGLQIKIAEGN